MAFVRQNNTVFAFADFDDVLSIDSRIFESNEGLTEENVEDALFRSTERILDEIRSTDWWKTYFFRLQGNLKNFAIGESIIAPAVDANKIIKRENDFSDMTVYYALSNYILPKVADFGDPDSAERQKMGYYDTQYRKLFKQLIDLGDWYDFDGSGTVDPNEKFPVASNLRRIR